VDLFIFIHGLIRASFVSLPAFQFSNDRNMSLTLAEQMKLVFSQPTRADVARVIAQYGAAFEEVRVPLNTNLTSSFGDTYIQHDHRASHA
jgi:hypothetical protein